MRRRLDDVGTTSEKIPNSESKMDTTAHHLPRVAPTVDVVDVESIKIGTVLVTLSYLPTIGTLDE